MNTDRMTEEPEAMPRRVKAWRLTDAITKLLPGELVEDCLKAKIGECCGYVTFAGDDPSIESNLCRITIVILPNAVDGTSLPVELVMNVEAHGIDTTWECSIAGVVHNLDQSYTVTYRVRRVG